MKNETKTGTPAGSGTRPAPAAQAVAADRPDCGRQYAAKARTERAGCRAGNPGGEVPPVPAEPDRAARRPLWQIVETPQFVQAISGLEEAHARATCESGAARMLIGETGCGKTLAVEQYCKAHPRSTFRVTVNDYDSVHDILGEIARQLGVELPERRGARLRAVGEELRRRARRGERNMLILDEAENTKLPGIRAYKAIYDMIRGHCAFVLVGTTELPRNIERLRLRGTDGVPQFARRFKAGTIYLQQVDRSFRKFLDGRVEDAGLRRLLPGLCCNYGELHDYLEPALRAAAEEGVPLTESYFRTLYYITSNE